MEKNKNPKKQYTALGVHYNNNKASSQTRQQLTTYHKLNTNTKQTPADDKFNLQKLTRKQPREEREDRNTKIHHAISKHFAITNNRDHD